MFYDDLFGEVVDSGPAVALRLDPESADSHAIAGLVSLRTGAGKESVLRYREALRLHPSDEHGKQAP